MSFQYKCKHFRIEELVSPAVFAAHGEGAWRFLHPEALIGIDALREELGEIITINNWLWKGHFRYSGLRASGEFPKSSWLSAHRHGKAFDMRVENVSPAKLQKALQTGEITLPGLTELELGTPTWTHVAFGTNLAKVLTFRP